MNKTLFLFFTTLLLIPTAALSQTSTVVASISASVSGTQSKEYQQTVQLSDGHYTLGLNMIGDALGETFAFTRLFEVIAETNAGTGLRLEVTKPLSIGGLPFSDAVGFDVVDGANKLYVWSYGINSYDLASASYTVDISHITAVPGPEAGAGVGALTALAIAFMVKRRRNL